MACGLLCPVGMLFRSMLALALAAGLSLASQARADTGHVAISAGAATIERVSDGGDDTAWLAHMRTTVGFRLAGPLELGGHLSATFEGAVEMLSFGGGLFLQLRPEEPLWGFVPFAEVAGSRVTLPSTTERFDAWGVAAGAGLGYELGGGVSITVEVHHQWYLDLPEESGIGVDGWTIDAGISYRLP